MDSVIKLVSAFADWLWGPPLLIILVGGGLVITLKLKFFQFRYAGFIAKQTFGKMFGKGEGEGTVSPFQAATAALASSIGAANIVVVPTIIFAAGPGAVFWMWITALLGQGTKFAEIVLGIKYREQNAAGEYVGGPAYYLKKGIGGMMGKILGFCVSFFFMLEILPSITLQTLSAVGPIEKLGEALFKADAALMRYIAIGLIFVLVALVVYGGIKRISKVTEYLVPFMALLYSVFAILIILMNIKNVPAAFKMIFVGAFNPTAVAGGAFGGGILLAIQKGVARGVYSNEAGMGSAPYAHSTAITDHPARQGMWGIFEVTVDTLIVCTMSALVVLTTGIYRQKEFASIAVERAFNQSFGSIGSAVISVSLFLFVLSTILVIVFYCEKCAEYCFGSAVGKIVRILATLMVVAALFVKFEHAGFVLDITLALVVIPNMIGVVWLSKEVKELTKDFFENKKYNPKAK